MDAAVDVLSDAGAGGGMDAAAGVLSDAARPLGMPIHVAIASAAADWFPPVTALGHVLEAVHSFTGLNWWTSIVLTTLLMKTSMDLVPLLLKSTMFKYNSTDPRPKEGKKFGELLEKYGVNASTLKVLKAFIRVSLDFSLFLAILNMVVKVPSLKEGGAYWFTDLTTRDDLYILPALASLTCLAAVELVMRHGMVGNPMLKTLKGYRVLLFLMIPFMTFPKAVLLHWITCNLFFLGLFFGRQPGVRSYCSNLLHLVTRRAPSQARPPGYNLSQGTQPMPSVVAVKGSELSSSKPNDQQMKDPEKKRRTSSVITSRVHGEGTSSDGQ